ncbi:MAG: thiamine pyrophosphate-binding protein, partial [Gemmatimonadota bacterium]|nr:thiamine pyrophosphate-binding protein [Gemmatimonadota bacterium]
MQKTMEKKGGKRKREKKERISGAEMLIRSLIEEDVECVFGYPGGVVIPIFDTLYHSPKPKLVLCRHEQ